MYILQGYGTGYSTGACDVIQQGLPKGKDTYMYNLTLLRIGHNYLPNN